jgi:TatD DNase family protein
MPPEAISLRLVDAHNHLQDTRLLPARAEILSTIASEGIVAMVVNGSCEADWPDVLALARDHPFVVPSLGYHPWYVKERSADWRQRLVSLLDQVPAAIGEIGLDRWIRDFDIQAQEETFLFQLQLAAERNLPLSIHCLQAWGRLLQLLQANPRPRCGFLLHSFGGPREMIPALAKLGAYFSFPGYFAHDRKERQREAFRHVPPERLLLETDAPDQLLPDALDRHPLTNPEDGNPLNHPANLRQVYEFMAAWLHEDLASLTSRLEENFQRLFGSVQLRRTTENRV